MPIPPVGSDTLPDIPATPVAESTAPQTQPASPTSVPEPKSEAEYAGMLKVADWQMNETSGQMIDSSGNDNNGTPTDVLQTGSTYVFNGSTSHVFVPDDDSLDPLDRDITLTASVRVNGESLDDDSYDIVRKGYHPTVDGDYKMEIKRTSDPTVGKLHCLFRGTGGQVNRVAKPDIVDGNWHTLECIKASDSVVARVNGNSYTKVGSAGSIANSPLLAILT